MGDELLHGQAQNVVNADFEGQGELPHIKLGFQPRYFTHLVQFW